MKKNPEPEAQSSRGRKKIAPGSGARAGASPIASAPRACFFVALCVALLLPLAGCRLAGGARPTIVYLVRHAEKQPDAGSDPPLSEAGARRADALAETLADAGVRAIYVTQFRRTTDTAAPLAARNAVTVTRLEVDHDDPRPYVERLAEEITNKRRGGTVTVVSHSNTLPLIVERLTGKTVPAIRDDQYGDLFVITLPAEGAASVVRARYGGCGADVGGAATSSAAAQK